jgi:hypothetical protein
VGKQHGPGVGELPAFVPKANLPARGASVTRTGFDEKLSKRVPSKSTATMTYYANPDGTATKKYQQSPVNYHVGDGWQPIDTTLSRGSDNRWHEKANSLAADFAPGGADPTLASLKIDAGHAVSYRVQGAAPVTPTANGSVVVYPGILPDTDLSLSATPTGDKDSLILHTAKAATSWVFPLTLTGLKPVQAKDGSIDLVDATGKAVERIPHGYAYDAKVDKRSGEPATTSKVDYQLTTVDGSPALKVTLDKAWLTDPARVFPVTVDPTVIYAAGSTYAELTNDGDHSFEQVVKVGSYNAGADQAVSYLKFPDTVDNSGTAITKADLYLYDTWASTCTPERLDVAPVNQSWTPSGVTAWQSKPTYGNSIGNATPSVPHACANTGADRSVGDWVDVPLSTDTFTGWSSGSIADNGLAVYADPTDALHW